VDSTQIPNSQRPHDEDLFPSNVYDDEYDVHYYCYSCVCMADHQSPQELPFYKDHWLIDSGASDHITSYPGDFSSILQGERLASTANGSIIQMHDPGTVIRKQDRPKAPPVLLQEFDMLLKLPIDRYQSLHLPLMVFRANLLL
jgi:hypothetical protein